MFSTPPYIGNCEFLGSDISLVSSDLKDERQMRQASSPRPGEPGARWHREGQGARWHRERKRGARWLNGGCWGAGGSGEDAGLPRSDALALHFSTATRGKQYIP